MQNEVHFRDDIRFSYDELEKKLRVKDGDKLKVFYLNHDSDELFLYILKAIDLLDNTGGEGTVTPEVVFPGSTVTEDPELEENVTIFVGGEP